IRAGCRNAAELHRELASRGSNSSACAVLRFMNRRLAAVGIRRERANAASPTPPPPPSARKLSFEFIRRPPDRSTEEQGRLGRLRACDAGVEWTGVGRGVRPDAPPVVGVTSGGLAGAGGGERVGGVRGVRGRSAPGRGCRVGRDSGGVEQWAGRRPSEPAET